MQNFTVTKATGMTPSKLLNCQPIFFRVLVMLTFFTGIFSGSLKAQYSNVPVTGFNCDNVLNGAGTALTSVTGGAASTTTVDYPVSGYFFAAADWTYNATGCAALTNYLPTNGQITANATTVGGALVYNLQSYAANNDLRIPATGGAATGTGTLTVTTPVPASNLFLLCTSGGAATTGINITVNFTDATTQVFTGLTIADWFTGGTFAQGNNGRIQQTVTTCATTSTGGPYLYDLALTLNAANYFKNIQSITIDKTNATGIINILAVGRKAPCTVPADGPTGLTQGATTTSSIVATWTAALSAPTGYLSVLYPTGATQVAPLNGTAYTAGQALGTGKVIQASAATSATASGLTGGTTYDVYVYSYNSGAACGGPVYNTANVATASMTTTACSGLAGGTYQVGPNAPASPAGFPTITAALALISSGITGPVILELQPDYVSTGETYPITFPANPCVGAVNSLTIRPSATATALSITSANTTGTINFNGGSYITIDGRPGGNGTASQLSIANTNAGASYALNYINDASSNTVKYCLITSRNTSATSGTIVFGTGSVSGNDNNTVDNCSILDGTSTPLNAIYSAGSSTSVDNSGITVSNCNIANYFGVAAAANGIYLSSNSSSWTITGNRFYQTATRTPTTGTQNRAIQIVTAGGGSYTITNNIIGYASSAGTGTTTYAGAFTNRFVGIEITSSTSLTSSIQGNTVSNISLTTSSAGSAAAPAFGGIVILGGNHNVGTVTGNIIGAATGTGAIVIAASTSSFYVHGIYATSTGTVSIVNNRVGSINAAGSAAAVGCLFYGVWGLGTAGNFTINSNIVGSTSTAGSITLGTDLFTTATTTQTFYGVRCDATGSVIVGASGAGNTIQNIISRSSNSAAFYGYYNGGAASSSSFAYNLLASITMGWTTTSGSGTLYCVYNASTIAGTYTVSNNTFQNLTALNTTGTIYLIYNSSSTATANFQNNTFNNITRVIATSGTMYAFYNGNFGSFSGAQTFTGNNFTNILNSATSGSGTYYGFYNYTSTGVSWIFSGNVFDNITTGSGGCYTIYQNYATTFNIFNNQFSNIASGSFLYGLYVASSSTTTANIYSNSIYGLSTSGASSFIYALYSTATTGNIYKNKIYNIAGNGATGGAYGIYTGGGTTQNIYNNLVGDIKAPASSLTAPAPSVAGLYISSGTTINAYYNTIHLTAASTGVNFGSAAVYASTTPTTINLRNNIFSNTSTPAGTGKSIAYQRSATALTNYATTSNNNLFYGGTAGANNLIFYDGTNSDQNIATFKTRMSTRDQASVAENPPFLSTSGTSANFLHINPATSTQIESGGAAIATFTDDFDGDTRNASTPDIGADEFAGTAAVVVVINSVSISPTGNQCTPASRTVTANITAGNSTITSVTLNYSFNGVAQTSVNMTGGNPAAGQTSTWTGTIPAAGSNVTVTWNVSATDAITTKSQAGTPYTDDPLAGVSVVVSASANPICANTSTNLTASLSVASSYANSFESGIGDFTTSVVGAGTPSLTQSSTYFSDGTKSMYLNTASISANIAAVSVNNINLGGLTSAVLTFSHIAAMEGPSTSYDYGYVEYSSDGGSTWTSFPTSSYAGTGTLFNSVVSFSTRSYANWISAFTGASSTPTNALFQNETINIPAAALTSQFKLRFRYTTDGSTNYYGWLIDNIRIASRAVPSLTGASYAWTDGTSTVSTTNPASVTPSATTNYSVAITLSGCTITSPGFTVNTIALPASPNGNNSTQCGTGHPGVFVTTGGGGGGYKWYLQATGGTAIPGETSASLSIGYSISTTTNFYVSESNGTCESLRTLVTATVQPADEVQITPLSSSICLNGTATLTASNVAVSPVNDYSYSWTGMGAGNGLNGATAGNPIFVTPTASGTYTYTVTATDQNPTGCVTTATSTVTVTALPNINSITATPSTICAGTSVTLNATSGNQGSGSVALGAGASTMAGYVTTGNEGFGNPYNYWYGNQRTQYIYTKAELNAAGMSAGNITALSYETTALGATPYSLTGFTISLGTTSQTAATSTIITSGLTNVYTNANQPISLGVNNYVFSTPFNWDGINNLVVTVCWGNSTSGSNANVATVKFDVVPFVSTRVIYTDGTIGTGICAATTGSRNDLVSNRPRTVFSAITGVNTTGSLNWVWNPGSLSGSSVTVNPVATTIYTVTATDPSTTCSNTATVTVTVNPLPPPPSGNNGTDQCGTALTDASVSSNNSVDPQSPPFFKWYLLPTGGTPVQTGTSTTYTTAISTTTTWYVSEVSANGCEGPRSLGFTTIVSDADPINVSATPSIVCLGISTNLTAAYTPTFNSFTTFSLTAGGGAGSGVTGTVSLTPNATGDGTDPYTVTPTATGTYTYTITAFDPDKGCTSVNTVVINVGSLPTIQSFTASPATICAGASSTLTALGAPHYANVPVTGWNTDVVANGVGAVSSSTTGTFDNSQYTLPASDWNFNGSCPPISFFVPSSGIVNGNSTVAPGVSYTLQPYTANNDLRIPATGSVTTGTGTLTVTTPVSMSKIYLLYGAGNGPITSGITVTVTFTDASTQVFSNLTALDWFATTNPAISNLGRVDRTATPACATTVTGGPQLFDLVLTLNGSNYSKLVQSIKIDKTITTGIMNVMGIAMEAPVYQTAAYNWTINPGGFTDSTHIVNPTTTTTYTATVTNPSTGCSASATATVTVNPLPAAPTTNDPVTRCGPGSVTLTASGAGGTLNWYNVATGGTSLATGGSYTTNVTATTSFYVAETSAAGCTGPRSQVHVNVTAAPTLAITPGGAITFCQGGNVTLNGASASDPSYTNFAWSSAPATGAGLSGTTGPAITVAPTTPGAYTITLTANDGQVNGCANTATVVVTSNPNPVITTATATPSTTCSGGTVTLNGTSINALPGTATSGAVTGTTSTSTTIGAFYGLYYGNGHAQALYTAAELTAAGLTPGNITSLGVNVGSIGNGTALIGYTIKIAATTATSLSAFLSPAFTTVFGPVTYSPSVGVNTNTFTSPFVWDGSSNIVVDYCFANQITGTTTTAVTNDYTTTAYNSFINYQVDGTTGAAACTVTTVINTSGNRPDLRFGGQIGTVVTNTLNWVWNPGGLTGSTVTVNPTSSTTYTATATNPSTGCFAVSSPVPVTVTPVAANATASPSTPVCAGTSVTLNAGATGGAPFTYSWTSTPAGTYAATAQITVNPAVTTSYTVTVMDACGNPTTSSVSVTVNPLPTAGIQEGPGPLVLCSPATQTLTAVTDAASASYQWTLNGSNIAGATSSTYTVSTVSSGMYRVIITNTATNCVSVPSAPVSVTINPQPAAVTVTPAISTICNGGSQSLTASGGTTGGSGTATIGTATTLTGAITQPTAFCNRWPSYRMQTLYTAAELTAAGLSAGNINSMSFNISTLGDGATNANFVVKVGTSALTVLSGDFVSTTSFTTVYPSQTYTHAVGVNVIPFTTPFVWNGTSNIIVEVIHSGANSINNSQTYYTATTGNMVAYTTTASTNAASFSTQRLNVVFAYSSLQNPTWSWLPVTGLNTTNGATVIASPAVTTTYTATATNSFGCTNSNTAVVNVNPRPTAVISGSGTYCQGTPTATNLTINFTGTAPWSYTYSDGTTPVSGTTSSNPLTLIVSPNNTNAGTTTYTVTALSDANCTAIAADLTGSATVTVNPTPATPTVTPAGPVTICSVNGPVVLTSSAATGNQWYMDGNIITGETGTTLNVTATGSYTVIVTNGFSCSSAASNVVTVTVNPTPSTPVITAGGATTFCQGGSVTLNSNAVTGNQWYNNGNIITGETGATLNVTASGSYTVVVTSAAGCASAVSNAIAVTVNPTPATPTVTPAGPVTICSVDGPVVLTSSAATGNQWYMDGNIITGQTGTTLNVTASGSYTVIAGSGAGCASAASNAVTVTVNPTPSTPVITAGGATTFCQGGLVTLSSNSATGNQWYNNGNIITGETGATLNVTASGSYTVVVTSAAGCASAVSNAITVTVNPLAANPTASVTQPTCTVATGTINVTSPLGGGNMYSLNGTTFQSSPSFPGQAPGTYTVYVQNSSGCFSAATVNVTVNPQPITPAAPTVTGITNVCPYIAINGGAPVTYHASAPGATGYTWTYPTSRVIYVSGQGTADFTVKFDTGYANVMNKQIRVTASSTCGTSTFTIFYTVAQTPITPNPISGPADACPYIGTATTATYTINKAMSATGYIWTVPSGATAVHANPAGINDTTITVTFTGGYVAGNVTVVATNDCGSSGARSIFVSRNAPSQPSLISGPTNACEYSAPATTPAVYSVINVAGVTYNWTLPAGATLVSGQGSNTINVLYPNGFTGGTISVTASSGCGTSTARTLAITKLNPAIPSVIDVIQTHFCGESGGRVFTYSLSAMPANATSIQWTVPLGAGAMIVSGQGSISITVSYPNTAVNGSVTAQALNNCGASTVRSTSVRLPACPPAGGFAATNGSNNTTTAQVKGATAANAQPATTESMEVKIFPNPTVSDFKLQVLTSQKDEINVRVFDNEGRLYKTFKLMPYQTIALGAELKAGSYMVEVRQGRVVKTSKVVKF